MRSTLKMLNQYKKYNKLKIITSYRYSHQQRQQLETQFEDCHC